MKKNVINFFPETENHVNGWPVIQHFLMRSHLTQSALAAHLRISPSAVSQIKQGRFLLNAEQLRATAGFLQLDGPGLAAFYAQIFRGRLLAQDDENELFTLSLATSPMPEAEQFAACPAGWLEAYEPVKESFGGFLTARGIADTGNLTIRWPASQPLAGVCGRGALQLRYREYPVPGDTVLLKCRDLPCRITCFHSWSSTGGNFADLAPGAPEKHILLAAIMWVHPAECLQIMPPEHPAPAAP